MSDSQRLAWNEGARVVCLLCGHEAESTALFSGCAACGVAAPLSLDYPSSPSTDLDLVAAIVEARQAFAVLPATIGTLVALSPTPLDSAPRLGAGVYLKNETFSRTGSHKDRYHTVVAALASQHGYRGLVASSTGNHGVSAAAHAAAHGLPGVVFCHAGAPPGLLRAIGAFGGIAVQLEAAAQRKALIQLVEDGWFPATTLDPVLSGAANPFGAEGYKAIAYEVVEQLGALPDAVFVPTAGGDTYFGIMKGFAELAQLTGLTPPIVIAIQPEGANPLSRSVVAGRQITVEQPESIALSLSDSQSGRHAMVAIERWRGFARDVSETAIHGAVVDLAAMGYYVDPASAAALAGYRQVIASGDLEAGATSVLLLTSSGFKWPDAMVEVFPSGAVQSTAELQIRLADLATPAERLQASVT